MKNILVADDQIPDQTFHTKDSIRSFYQDKYKDRGFAEGFVFLFDLVKELQDNGYNVTTTNSIASIDKAINDKVYDAIILDLGWWTDETMDEVKRMSIGWDIADKIRLITPAPIIMFSNRFPNKPDLTKIAAEKGLFPIYKSYDINCINNLLVTLKYMITVNEGADYLKHKNEANKKIFIGHGRSRLWKDLKDYINDRLKLNIDEFNNQPVAGITISDRLNKMLDSSRFAFLVMTAEDAHADNSVHARENVIHEIGLFQGRLGFTKAIVLIEECCSEFSNIHGLSEIRFPKDNIKACFEEVRGVLERENIF